MDGKTRRSGRFFSTGITVDPFPRIDDTPPPTPPMTNRYDLFFKYDPQSADCTVKDVQCHLHP